MQNPEQAHDDGKHRDRDVVMPDGVQANDDSKQTDHHVRHPPAAAGLVRRESVDQPEHADDNRGEARCHEGWPGAPGEIWPESGLIDLRHLRVAEALLTPGYRGASTGWFPR